ncbi:MAG: hypothetical protein PHP03_00005 [Candidatus Pacebacteria bacterium]|nr:hypothetical protein [Candidatus Paceibacterota bacterium]
MEEKETKKEQENMAAESAAENRAAAILETIGSVIGNKTTITHIVMELRQSDWDGKRLELLNTCPFVFKLSDVNSKWLVGAAKIVWESCEKKNLKPEIVEIKHSANHETATEIALNEGDPNTYKAIQITIEK